MLQDSKTGKVFEEVDAASGGSEENGVSLGTHSPTSLNQLSPWLVATDNAPLPARNTHSSNSAPIARKSVITTQL